MRATLSGNFASHSRTVAEHEKQVPQEAKPGHCLHVVSHLHPRYGGMSTVVPQLCDAVNRDGRRTASLATFCRADERFQPETSSHVPIFHFDREYSRRFEAASGTSVDKLVEEATELHIHGLWESSTALAVYAAHKFRRPFVMSAHGMLQPWALRSKRWKKAVYGALIERPNLRRAACLHALTSAEVDDYRRYGLTNPIAVIPNGVSPPANIDREAIFRAFPTLRNKELVLFLGRLNRKKGLDILCQAWRQAVKRCPDAHLVLAGPNTDGLGTFLASFAEQLQVRDRVTLTGHLDDRLKWSALAAAKCFVLPSYSEGLSTAVLEALVVGVPVIVTRFCNVPEVETEACGWVIDANVPSLDDALRQALTISERLHDSLSRNARELATRKYGWSRIGSQMTSVYRWLHEGIPPEDVEIDSGVRL
jgi:glycosyltransferase involved in cell wall biosynthesis